MNAATTALIIVDSFYARDVILRTFKLKRLETPIVMNDNHIDCCKDGNRSVLITVPRVPGGVQGFWDKAKTLFSVIHAPIYIFNKGLETRPPDTPNHVKINASTLELCHVVNAGTHFEVSEEQQMDLQVALTARRVNNVIHTRLVSPPEFIRQWQPLPVRRRLEREDEGEEDDPDLALGIQLSLQEEDKPLKKLRILPTDWKFVLKEKSEPIAKEGDPVCKVCLEHRPSICFVPCGHQVACDECVRIMWTESKIHQVCIVCKTPVENITRPIL